MNKEFIPYEESIALKELGFDEECLDKYDPRFEKLSSDMQTWTTEHYPQTLMIPAPLYQQAFRWFRDKHGLHHLIEFDFDIYNAVCNCSLVLSCTTYEEAELACLKKLIEIVKNK